MQLTVIDLLVAFFLCTAAYRLKLGDKRHNGDGRTDQALGNRNQLTGGWQRERQRGGGGRAVHGLCHHRWAVYRLSHHRWAVYGLSHHRRAVHGLTKQCLVVVCIVRGARVQQSRVQTTSHQFVHAQLVGLASASQSPIKVMNKNQNKTFKHITNNYPSLSSKVMGSKPVVG